MTEDQAKTKWCPFFRAVGTEPASNRDRLWIQGTAETLYKGHYDETQLEKSCLCIGSTCMAWRMTERSLQMDMDDKGIFFRPIHGDIYGYCGLAGKP